jgi:serine/threonine protein kinase
MGFYDDPGEHRNRFVLQFEIPAGKTNPKILQDLLTDDKNQQGLVHSLSDRVTLAKKIASGLLFFHAGGFVHKKVNPTNIFVFETETGAYPGHIGEPYLTGFDLVRKADQASARLATEDWRENIYLHPDRHRLQPGDEFTMLHDIYSLGVVLLEIACWSSFTDLRGIGKYLLTKDDKSQLLGPDGLKKQYIRLAEKHIPPHLGSNYSELVKSCLDGLPNEDGTPRAETAAAVGSSYMEQVMGQLEQINL